MIDILQRFAEVHADPYGTLKETKQRTKRGIICCYPMHIPEELVHAAGLLPVVLTESNEPITLAHSHIQSFFCGLARTNIDVAMKGRLDFLDGVVVPELCLPLRGMANIMKRDFHFTYFKSVQLPIYPKRTYSKRFFVEELRKFKDSLEKFTGQEITGDSIKRSISVYNRNRTLLRRFYEVRRRNPGLLSARQVLAAVEASMLLPKEEHSQLLEDLLPSLEEAKPVDGAEIRVILTGSMCTLPQSEVLEVIEDSGVVVVDDDLYAGSRYFANDVPSHPNPLEALADRYSVMNVPCPTRAISDNDWAEYVKDMYRRSHAQGVISLMVKYCEPHNFWYPHMRRKLQEAGIPEFMIETEHGATPLGQIRTRIQAFVEMLEAGGPSCQ